MDGKANNLLKRLQHDTQEFSKGQKLLAAYISEYIEKAAYMTASRLGEVVGVSESTVVRFAVELGYDGYPTMQKALQDISRSKLTMLQRVEVSNSRIDHENILKSVLHADIDNIKQSLEELDNEEFNRIVDAILDGKKIYVIGIRSSATLASFLAFYFNLIFDNVWLVNTNSVSEMFEQILHVGVGDVVVGISFPRYSTRTIKAMRYATDQGCTTIAITDSKDSPLSQVSTHSLFARSDMASFVDSLVAPLSVINALLVAVSLRRSEHVAKSFDKLEKIWDEYKVYEKYEQEDEN
ncbi:MAG: MurR/RpiR family transcriptional regulator [Bacillota bacterium]